MNKEVISWYCGQIICYIGIIVSIYLFHLIHQRYQSPTQQSSLTFFKTWIYIFYGNCIFLFIAEAMIQTILTFINDPKHQKFACNIVNLCATTSASLFYVCIFNIFANRLYFAFKGTFLRISKSLNYTIRIIHVSLFLFIAAVLNFIIDVSPYNIYEHKVDHEGNGVTCSVATNSKMEDNIMIRIFILFATFFIISSNILIWSLFMIKLYKLIKHSKHNKNVKLVSMMKEQTLIVALSVFSTVFLMAIQSSGIFGLIPLALDWIMTSFVVFLSFQFNRKYFVLFKCDKLAICCCWMFEQNKVLNKGRDHRDIDTLTKTEDIFGKNCRSLFPKQTDLETMTPYFQGGTLSDRVSAGSVDIVCDSKEIKEIDEKYNDEVTAENLMKMKMNVGAKLDEMKQKYSICPIMTKSQRKYLKIIGGVFVVKICIFCVAVLVIVYYG